MAKIMVEVKVKRTWWYKILMNVLNVLHKIKLISDEKAVKMLDDYSATGFLWKLDKLPWRPLGKKLGLELKDEVV